MKVERVKIEITTNEKKESYWYRIEINGYYFGEGGGWLTDYKKDYKRILGNIEDSVTDRDFIEKKWQPKWYSKFIDWF